MSVTGFEKFYSGKKVLVTGHTGFKGAWLSEWLLILGAKVSGFSIDIPTKPSLFETLSLGNRLNDHRGDVCNFSVLRKIFQQEKPEIVFHLAAQPIVRASYDNPKFTFDTNLGGTVNVMEAIRETASVHTAVIITTDKCYENSGKETAYKETDALGGSDPYSASKACAEIAFSSYARSFFMKADAEEHQVFMASARAGNVIGGGDWAQDRIVADCIKAWSKNEAVELRNPNSVRPWQHVLEPVGAYLLLGALLQKNPKYIHGEAFNFGPSSDTNFRTIDLVAELETLWPGSKYSIAEAVIDGKKEAKLLRLDCAKAARLLSWQPALNLKECADWLVTWYRCYYENPSACRDLTEQQILDYQKKLLEKIPL